MQIGDGENWRGQGQRLQSHPREGIELSSPNTNHLRGQLGEHRHVRPVNGTSPILRTQTSFTLTLISPLSLGLPLNAPDCIGYLRFRNGSFGR